MSGTILCGVTDSTEGRDAIQFALALSRRLRQRLVLVSTQNETSRLPKLGPRTKRRRDGDDELIQELRQFALQDKVELRQAVGEPAHDLAQIAAEEGADLIVLSSRRAALGRYSVNCKLALELESITAIPVVIAPPQTRRRSEQRLTVV